MRFREERIFKWRLKKSTLKAVDFFCGAGGMSFGLSRAGISVLGGVDNDSDCRETYENNILGAKFIKHDIGTLSAPELGRRLNLRRNDASLVFAGCSPCQFWSKIRTDKTKSERTAMLLKQFRKFVHYFQPGFVVVENVPGLFVRKEESVLPEFVQFLENNEYAWGDGIINANHYGVPQNRMRDLHRNSVLPTVDLPPAQPDPSLTVAAFIGHGTDSRKSLPAIAIRRRFNTRRTPCRRITFDEYP